MSGAESATPWVPALWSAALLLVSCMVGGAAQSWWFASPWSRGLLQPLDGGRTFRGRRIFGDNKTVRGFVVIVPATAVAMWALGTASSAAGLPVWALSRPGYLGLGGLAALGIMLGELPNSFLKRQLDVAPGSPPAHPIGRVLTTLGDRLDSVIGALLGASLIVDLSWQTVVAILILAPPVHGAFSLLFWVLGIKKRPG